VDSLFREERLVKLRRFHFGLAALHGITAIVLAGLTNATQSHSTVPWYSNLPLPRPTEEDFYEWGPDARKQTSVPVGYFSSAFLALACVNHLVSSTLMWKTYKQNLVLHRNPIRWFEYGFSAGLMHVHVAMICGIMDVHQCFLIFGLTMTTMLFGYFAEPSHEVSGNSDIRAFWAGFIPYTFQMSVMMCYFFYALSRGSPPHWVYAIWFIILGLDLSFAVNMFLQLNQIGWWDDYIHVEISFCILSLTAKQLLAWINYGGTASLPHQS
jgi:hypothetical protein